MRFCWGELFVNKKFPPNPFKKTLRDRKVCGKWEDQAPKSLACDADYA